MSILGYKEKEEIVNLKAKVNDLYKQLSPDQQKAMLLRAEVTRLEKEKRELDASVSSKAQELSVIYSAVEWRKKQLIQLDCEVLYQECALYRPSYGFASSEQYSSRLTAIRQLQKTMVRNNTAIMFYDKWHMNESAAQSREIPHENIKLILRTFNVECDNIVNNVTVDNYNSMRALIIDSYENLNKFNVSALVAIRADYLNLKLEELSLALEYAIKKREEEEEQIRINETLCEQETVQKELDSLRKSIVKEQQHLENSLRIIDLQLASTISDEQRAVLRNKRTGVHAQLKKYYDSIKEIDYRDMNQKAGYIYILSNIGAFGEDVFKVGITRRLNPAERIAELGDSSVPFPFDLHALIFSYDAPKLQAALARALGDKRVNVVNNQKDFFRVSLEEMKDIVNQNCDKPVEFKTFPEAEQFRRSQAERAAEQESSEQQEGA